ncbi:MAG: cytochrome c3 family protein [bacterium]
MKKIKGGFEVSLHVNGQMVHESVHDGLACIDCHTALQGNDDWPHVENLPGVNCADCHADAVQEYMEGFYQHLASKGFRNIPNCTQCHGTHQISRHADTRQVCGICHNEQRKQFESSVHFSAQDSAGKGKVSCTSCHDAHDKTKRGKMLPADWRRRTVDVCLDCHKAQAFSYLNSRHYEGVRNGDVKAPVCIDCHGAHDVHAIDDPRSNVYIDNLDKTCDKCHPGHEATIHRKAGADPRLMTCVACHTGHQTQMDRVKSAVFKETLPNTCNRCHGEERHKKENLAHGKIMIMDNEGGVANCTKCHLYHWALPDPENQKVARERLSCKNCHKKENLDYERSAHGIAYRKGHTEAPTCTTCHGDKNVERISSRFDGQTIISLCSSCHANTEVTMKFQLNPNVVSGYLSTYHGQMYALGYQGEKFATCVSCHDNHLILPKDNPESSISRQHIIQTCSRCHKDANENFVGMLQHYDPMTQEENPILKGIHTFMVWLLGITLTIFGTHTLLWLGRATYDRIRHGKVKKIKSEWRYTRFNKYDRALHALVIISFLTLAMTGLPLKYSQSEASRWIAENLIPLRTMAIFHRIGASITFLYFALHLGGLGLKLIRRKVRFIDMFWGENTLMPQPRDVVQFIQHVGWFLGIAQKPRFGRFSYWEKFDYMAVFWGVAVIGLSGLTLWFPEFFTKILPGWAINAAHIIHSEEALLATGFIFTIHFFNEHLRPENFPFDEVIFSGSMSEHYLFEERPGWREQLEAEARLEKIRVKPIRGLKRVLMYLFGFGALFIGMALLALIVAGTFF